MLKCRTQVTLVAWNFLYLVFLIRIIQKCCPSLSCVFDALRLQPLLTSSSGQANRLRFVHAQ